MSERKKHVIIVAGEASGDMHAARLVDELKKIDPSISFSGLGGQSMKASGVELYADLTRLAVIGFVEVVRHYDEIRQLFELVLDKVRETKADAVILVDYPGFNLRLAKALKKHNIKVFYYISPQVWAWKASRIKAINRYTDKMFVLFDFEKEFYARHNTAVEFVGHPLVDMIQTSRPREQVLQAAGLKDDRLTIGILPGSREKEIERILPVMLDAAGILASRHREIQFLLLKAPTIDLTVLGRYLAGRDLPLKIIQNDIINGIHACDVCMVTSGTATLETAILQKPMVVVYKTSLLTWLLAKLLIRIPCIGLVNIVARQPIVPECIQFTATGQHIADELENIFTDEVKLAEIKSSLGKVKNSLGQPGASRRTAQEILKSLS